MPSTNVNASACSQNIFVARQPIVDARGRAVAYELLFRDPGGSAQIDDDLLCTSAVIERMFGSIGINRLLEGKDAFLNCSAEFLFSEFVDVLPAHRFVLEVLESCELSPELAVRCFGLRQRGFRIALDDVRELTPEIMAFLPCVDIVKLDWPFIDSSHIGSIVKRLKKVGVQVLAEKIERCSERELALEAGCDLLQGYYFARPTIMAARRSMPPVAAVLKIVDLITQDAPQALIVQALNGIPMLVVQLLRLANSGSQPRAHATPVSSVQQAMAMAGNRRVMQWCCLLLYANPDGLPVEDDPLALLAMRRAIFMGKVASKLNGVERSMEDTAFLTGMLSLLPLACGMDAQAFFGSIALSDVIRLAILERRGLLGQVLYLTEYVERGDTGSVTFNRSSDGASSEPVLEFPSYY